MLSIFRSIFGIISVFHTIFEPQSLELFLKKVQYLLNTRVAEEKPPRSRIYPSPVFLTEKLTTINLPCRGVKSKRSVKTEMREKRVIKSKNHFLHFGFKIRLNKHFVTQVVFINAAVLTFYDVVILLVR